MSVRAVYGPEAAPRPVVFGRKNHTLINDFFLICFEGAFVVYELQNPSHFVANLK